MDDRFSFTLSSRHSPLAELNRFLQEIGERWGLSENEVSEWNLVLDELVTNAIAYGFDDQDEHVIRIRLVWTDDRIEAEVEDEGRPFDPLTVPPADLDAPVETRKIGGLGLHFVRSLADRLAYRRAGEKNILTIVRRRTRSGA